MSCCGGREVTRGHFIPVGLSVDQVMIEEMQEQEAEFLKEQKEKKLKNRCWTEEPVDISRGFHNLSLSACLTTTTSNCMQLTRK